MTTLFALEIELTDDIYQALRQAAAELDKSEAEVAADAIQAYLYQLQSGDPLLGLFADEPDIIDAVTSDAMRSREQTPWRIVGQ